ncbi:MAG: sigma-70 family RNA polymerase sigma factor [Bacteroidetes bacterium]|nr:MAG: sigma-70 family RNA polymerase sigma factor [Bacteroidota bacterium]
MKEYTDFEIIECLRNRQSYVVRYLSDRYIPMIRLMICQMGGTNEDAHDIFQDGLIIMLEKIDNKDFVLTCKFKTYLYCVCEYLWKAVLDKRRAAANYFMRKDEADSEKDFTELIDREMYENIFRNVFETLDPVSKTILNLYWQEISPQEIADKLGYTYGYVRKKKSEAQSELTEKVKKHPGYRRIMSTESAVRDVVY